MKDKIEQLMMKPGSIFFPLKIVIGPGGRHDIVITKASGLDKNCFIEGWQYIGLHECFCLTMTKPKRVTSMMTIAKEIQEIDPFGQVQWFGAAKVVFKDDKIIYQIPRKVWEPVSKALGTTLHLDAIAHTIKKGKGPFTYNILELPGLLRGGKLFMDCIRE